MTKEKKQDPVADTPEAIPEVLISPSGKDWQKQIATAINALHNRLKKIESQ